MTRRDPLAEVARYSQIGVTLLAPMLVLGGLGFWLDRRWGTTPWLLLAGLVLGMIIGFVNFFRLVLPAKGSESGPGRCGR